ncbi:2-oxo-4-hydroxy-4-carboxy-5-ureidoimidazoline decarboxylase [Streptomyces boncukensis]|uniref:2-oxo-4-hydroxy-4-carboxy-5-ureidoimidazoline decarboxylase n=1 Tax=Streptomyces boncukensis TaxID=2711219 RepID=A0A6G4WXE3_9ACTN|nr:2-oxo-4-hydroxy-4-carboxy-5-ureidoimidazoline decarboxylase [Streptomyces boncukensis]NGO69905.1 2-oxo-4-hydroxy-4-carboxy-5-ureidoimidazoline decarboxylase [Streptomyces boncukensis]
MPLPPQRSEASTPLPPLERINDSPPAVAEEALLGCCGSARWARRIAAHRPYPDLEALLAAADEASYDLTAEDLTQALAAEAAPHPPGYPAWEPQPGTLAAHTALRAAQAAYESRFRFPFVMCLDEWPPGQRLDQTLAAIRVRLGHEEEEERAVAADELRKVARGRLARLVAGRVAGPTVAD